MKKGLFIAIEGGDGSGKATQAKLLSKHLKRLKHKTLELSFPQYDSPSAHFAIQYLNGLYGGANDIHPDLASLAYAVDRFAAKEKILAAKKLEMDIVLDRYVGSNLAHQGAKIADLKDRKKFYKRILELEYGTLGLPEPDFSIVLLVPSEIAQQNVDKKQKRSYTDKKRDVHEADASHLELAKRGYEELCRLFPKKFIAIRCMDGDGMRSIEDIHQEIVDTVKNANQ